ncbi:MAG: FIST N-terminal domain-containing protein [Nannocystaceae bacterium]
MLQAASVSCSGDDSRAVGKDLGSELLDSLGRDPDVVLLFAATRYASADLLDGLAARLSPRTRVVGCTSCAEINSEEALSDSATAMGLCLDGVDVAVAHARDDADDSAAIGRRLGEDLRDFDPSLVILFVDGTRLNSTPLLAGMQAVLGRDRPIVGGVAADDLRFVRTEEFVDGEALSGAAVALALRGPLRVESVVASGWQAMGRNRVITRAADSKTITELDGEPALEVYRTYLGGFGRDIDTAGLEFPIGVLARPGEEVLARGDAFIRAVQGPAADGRGVRVSGDIEEGSTVRLMRTSREALIDSARAGIADAVAAMPAPAFALVFDCAGRKVVLGPRYKDELAAALSALPPGLPTVGFFTYGELAPRDGETIHHDETFTAVLVGVDGA